MDSQDTPKFIRNKITGIIYDYNPNALKRPENDYEIVDVQPETKVAAPAPTAHKKK